MSPIVLLRWCTQSATGMIVGTVRATFVHPRSVFPVLSDTMHKNRAGPIASIVCNAMWRLDIYRVREKYTTCLHSEVSEPIPRMQLGSCFLNL